MSLSITWRNKGSWLLCPCMGNLGERNEPCWCLQLHFLPQPTSLCVLGTSSSRTIAMFQVLTQTVFSTQSTLPTRFLAPSQLPPP